MEFLRELQAHTSANARSHVGATYWPWCMVALCTCKWLHDPTADRQTPAATVSAPTAPSMAQMR